MWEIIVWKLTEVLRYFSIRNFGVGASGVAVFNRSCQTTWHTCASSVNDKHAFVIVPFLKPKTEFSYAASNNPPNGYFAPEVVVYASYTQTMRLRGASMVVSLLHYLNTAPKRHTRGRNHTKPAYTQELIINRWNVNIEIAYDLKVIYYKVLKCTMLPKNIKKCGLNVPSYHHRIYVRIKAAITTPPNP